MSLPARLTAMLTLVAAALPFITAESASAYAICPRPTTTPNYDIARWYSRTPTDGTNGGVALCEGVNFLGEDTGWLHIADLSAGGRIRVWTKADQQLSPLPGYGEPNTVYEKMTANGWYTFLQNLNRQSPNGGWARPYSYPDSNPARLVSVVNAAFFKDSNPLHGSTTLPLPHWNFNGDPGSWGIDDTLGVAVSNMSDPDYLANHRALRVGNPMNSSTHQQAARITNIPPYYIASDVYSAFQNVGSYLDPNDPATWDAVAGFDENYQIGDRARRNYIGIDGSKIYMYTTAKEYTNAQMITIMRGIDPYMTMMQLDGGGSAQLYGPYGSMDSDDPLVDREVPSVIAFYQGY